jgi:hypothetical protein
VRLVQRQVGRVVASHAACADLKRLAFAAMGAFCYDAPSAKEPVSPHPALSFVSATTLPTPARFRPLGPSMFDSPTIAS